MKTQDIKNMALAFQAVTEKYGKKKEDAYNDARPGTKQNQKDFDKASKMAAPKDKVSLKKAPWDESLDESPEQPRAKGEKEFKKMHDDNTEIVDEKDGEDKTFDNIKKSANSIKK